MADVPTRESLVHALYEAAELEHNLMCTYLYAAFSLKSEGEGLTAKEAEAVSRWRRVLLEIAVEEMSHLTAVWNVTAALGAAPRFGRTNFPLDPGLLPAGVVVKLAPFGEASLQHFVHLERPEGSDEPDGDGFEPEVRFTRGFHAAPRLTPMALDYETVGAFYAELAARLRAFVDALGEKVAFAGDPELQLSSAEVDLAGARPVICSKTALAAFRTIVEQGEGAPLHSSGSHFQKFADVRAEYRALLAENPAFSPAWPAATNPVLRPPFRREGRVWIEHQEAAETVDLANTGYSTMLRLLAYAYVLPRTNPNKRLVVDLGVKLMRAVTLYGERAARLPAGPSNPDCHAGMSFTALRDASPLLPGASAAQYFVERFEQMKIAADRLARNGDDRTVRAARLLADLTRRVAALAGEPHTVAPARAVAPAPAAEPAPPAAAAAPPVPRVEGDVEHIEGRKLTLLFEQKRCIHARFCVTGAPDVFLANVKGPWISPDATEVESLVEIAHACPSGAIRYVRKDGKADERAPKVNLLAVREGGPYAVRGELRLAGAQFRATLCRCGASKNKPFCDGSHHDVKFDATGEPPSGTTDMLPVRNGPLEIDPELDGPLQVRGNLEITSGTGRVVARVTQARLCRCGASAKKPFCDGSHARVGFRSE